MTSQKMISDPQCSKAGQLNVAIGYYLFICITISSQTNNKKKSYIILYLYYYALDGNISHSPLVTAIQNLVAKISRDLNYLTSNLLLQINFHQTKAQMSQKV